MLPQKVDRLTDRMMLRYRALCRNYQGHARFMYSLLPVSNIVEAVKRATRYHRPRIGSEYPDARVCPRMEKKFGQP